MDAESTTDAGRPQIRWRSRGYLPHLEHPGMIQAVTFRLADSLPAALVAAWRDELASLAPEDRYRELRHLVERYLDRGIGACHLRHPTVARTVEEALLHFDGDRYRVVAWCVMPNHVHAVIETRPAFPLDAVLHSWKSFTAKAANRILGRSGVFWQREYHDRFVRDATHLEAVVRYVELNPVTAGLAARGEEWRWSSYWRRMEGAIGAR